MTKVALRQETGLSVRSLYEFESGRSYPSESALDAIAAAVKFPVSFFFREELEEPSAAGVSFRSLKSMTASQRDAALAAGALAFELSEWIDRQFELPAPDVPDLRDFHPEDAAIALRNHWAIGQRPIGNMVHLLESKGIRVFSLAEPGKQVDAFSLFFREVPFVFLNTMKTAEHSRMDAAHELGHLVLHRHGSPKGRDVEKDAQAFGAAFLMPRGSVKGLVPRLNAPSLKQLAELKQNWRVSVAALAHRLHALQLLSDWSYRQVCIQISQFGRTREPYGIERETSQVFTEVFRSLRDSGITKALVAKQLDWYAEDLDPLIFGLSPTDFEDGHNSTHSTSTPTLRIVN